MNYPIPATRYILLAGGNYLDLLEPENSFFTRDAIAKGLSNTCRFGGQCEQFYSVAEHSILTSQIVPEKHALQALLHDAAEAFVGDVAAPLKALLPDFKKIEKRILKAIFDDFDIPYPLAADVKIADLEMLKAEKIQVMDCADEWAVLEGVQIPDVHIAFLDPHEAMTAFLIRCDYLIGEARNG